MRIEAEKRIFCLQEIWSANDVGLIHIPNGRCRLNPPILLTRGAPRRLLIGRRRRVKEMYIHLHYRRSPVNQSAASGVGLTSPRPHFSSISTVGAGNVDAVALRKDPAVNVLL